MGYPGGPESTGSSNGVTVTPQELMAAGATIEGLSVSINASNSAVRSIVEQTARGDRPMATLSFVRNRCEMAERSRRLVRIAQQEHRAESPVTTRQTGFATALLLVVEAVSIAFVWLPINVLASPASYWSPWPTWSAGVLNDFGVKARDFEVFDHRYALHELYDEDRLTDPVSSTNLTSPANQPD